MVALIELAYDGHRPIRYTMQTQHLVGIGILSPIVQILWNTFKLILIRMDDGECAKQRLAANRKCMAPSSVAMCTGFEPRKFFLCLFFFVCVVSCRQQICISMFRFMPHELCSWILCTKHCISIPM